VASVNRSQRLDSFAERAKVRPADLFVKVHMERITGAMLMSDPDLLPRDVALLLALVGEMDPGTGRINLSASSLAKKCGVRQSNVATSLSRLKKKLLVINRKDKNSGAYYMLVNPDFASVGGSKTRAIAYKQFINEWVSALEEELDGDREKALATMRSIVESNQESMTEQRRLQEQEEEELARLVQQADPRLQALLAGRKVFKPMSDERFSAKIGAT